jgi:hypothetical protein
MWVGSGSRADHVRCGRGGLGRGVEGEGVRPAGGDRGRGLHGVARCGGGDHRCGLRGALGRTRRDASRPRAEASCQDGSQRLQVAARSARRPQLPASWIPPTEVLEWPEPVPLYESVVDQRTQWVQRIHAELFQHPVTVPECAIRYPKTRCALDESATRASPRATTQVTRARVRGAGATWRQDDWWSGIMRSRHAAPSVGCRHRASRRRPAASDPTGLCVMPSLLLIGPVTSLSPIRRMGNWMSRTIKAAEAHHHLPGPLAPPAGFEPATHGLGIRSRLRVQSHPVVFGLLSFGPRLVESALEPPSPVPWVGKRMGNSAPTSRG